MPNRDDFSKKTIETLAKRVSYRCSNPNCRKVTIGANTDSSKATNIGEAAHITAASPGGPRYNSKLTAYQRKSYENAIWLCSNCATLIDRDPTVYSEQLLKEWKRTAEKASFQMVNQNLPYEEHLFDLDASPVCTLLVGNGFDISFNMNTSYEEFFTWYCSQPINSIYCTIKNKYEDFVKIQISKNRWNTWSDFEKDLISFACTCESLNDFKILYYDILLKISEYILLNQERVLCDLTQVPSLSSLPLNNDILDWEIELDEDERFMISGDNRYYDYRYKFINFNFSIVFDEIVRNTINEPDIIHVHGNLKDPQNIIVGVDNISLIQTCFKEEDLYFLIKNNSHIIEGFQKTWIKRAEGYLNDSNVICIYGMSIGKTDSIWWKKIVLWLLNDRKHHLIIFWHNTNSYDLLDKRSIKNTVINRFLRFGDLSNNEKSTLFTNIHVVINPRKFLQVVGCP